MSVLVRLNRHRFVMADADVAGFEAEVLAAVKAGGAFVRAGAAAGGWRVLVTPATTVLVQQQVDVATENFDGDGFADLSFLDVDFDS